MQIAWAWLRIVITIFICLVAFPIALIALHFVGVFIWAGFVSGSPLYQFSENASVWAGNLPTLIVVAAVVAVLAGTVILLRPSG